MVGEDQEVRTRAASATDIEFWGPFGDGTVGGALGPSILRYELARRGVRSVVRFAAPIGEPPVGGFTPYGLVSPISDRRSTASIVLAPGLSSELAREIHHDGTVAELQPADGASDLLVLGPRVVDRIELAQRAAALKAAALVPDDGERPFLVVTSRDVFGKVTMLAESIAREVAGSRRPVLVVSDGGDEGGGPAADDLVRLLSGLHRVDTRRLTITDPIDLLALVHMSHAVAAGSSGSAALAAAAGRPHAVVVACGGHPVPEAVVGPDRVGEALAATSSADSWKLALADAQSVLDRAIDDLLDAIGLEGSDPPSLGVPEVDGIDRGAVEVVAARAAAERERWIARVEELEARLADAQVARRDFDGLRRELERMRSALIVTQAGQVRRDDLSTPERDAVVPDTALPHRLPARTRIRSRAIAAIRRAPGGDVALSVARRSRERLR